MRAWRRALSADRGFTVVEVVGATAVLLIVATGVMGALQFATWSAANSSVRDRAMTIANQHIEQARNLPYDDVGLTSGDPHGVIPPQESVATSGGPVTSYLVTTTVTWVRDPISRRAKYKSVTIGVSWNQGIQSGRVSVATSIFGKSNLINAGDLLLTLLDRDTAARLSGAVVTATPAGGDVRVVSTDETGEAFFGYLPTGQCAVDVWKDGYLVDTSSLATVTIAADALTELTVIAQRYSQAIVTVLQQGSPVRNAVVRIQGQGPEDTSVHVGRTGDNGTAVFDGLWADTYAVTAVSPDGVSSGTGSLTIDRGNSTGQTTIALRGPSRLIVSVAEPDGTAVANATVEVHGPDSQTANVAGSPGTTDGSGLCAFYPLAAGHYYISVSAPNHESATTETDLAPETTVTVPVSIAEVSLGEVLVTTVRWWWPNPLRGGVPLCIYQPKYSPYTYYDATSWRTSTTDATVLITGLAPGTYWIKPTGGVNGSPVSVDVVAGVRKSVTLRVTN